MAVKRVARAASQQFADLQSAYSRLYNAHSDLQKRHANLQARHAALQDRHLGLLVLLDGATIAPSETTPTIN